MKNYNFEFILIFICIVFLILVYCSNNSLYNIKKDKLFYDVTEINPQLLDIDKIKKKIFTETENIYLSNNLWNDWPEKYLYNDSNPDGWKIFPFYAFGIWVEKNCNLCPEITKFLKSISGLKLATLSKLKPKTKLNKHEGWASHSNHVIRCHYGLVVRENCCYIYVEDIGGKKNNGIKYHKKFEWLCFDDSKTHYAENSSDIDRIVLIVDIERPANIEIGKSDVGDTKELLEIVNYFKKKKILK